VVARSPILRLTDIVEATDRVRGVLGNTTLDMFETDWQSQWLVERGVEIISEASRHLTDELKASPPEIPWKKVAGIGNILRHDHGNISAPIMWKLVHADLPDLEKTAVKNSQSWRQAHSIAYEVRGLISRKRPPQMKFMARRLAWPARPTIR
jgi:uncharacterized protein with HEPN domain